MDFSKVWTTIQPAIQSFHFLEQSNRQHNVNNHKWDNLFRRNNFVMHVFQDRYIFVAGGYHYLYKNSRDGGENQIMQSIAMYDALMGKTIVLPNLPNDQINWPVCAGAILDEYFYVFDSNTSIFCIQICTDGVMYQEEHEGWKKIPISLRIPESLQQERRTERLLGIQSVVSDNCYLYLLDEHCNFFSLLPKINKWNALPRMQIPRMGFAITIVKQQIFVIGGFSLFSDKKNYMSSVEIFDISTQSWKNGPDLTVPTHSMCCKKHDFQTLTLINQRRDKILNGGLSFASASAIRNKFVFVSGGLMTGDIPSSSCYFLDLRAHPYEWVKSHIEIPSHRMNHASAYISYKNKVGANEPKILCPKIILIGNEVVSHEKRFFSPMESIFLHHFQLNWKLIKDFVLLRALVDKNRAVLDNCSNVAYDLQFEQQQVLRTDHVIQRLIIHLNKDIFRYVLTFII